MWTRRGRLKYAHAVGFALVLIASAALLSCGGRSQRVEAQAGQAAPQTHEAGTHSIGVTFDYDFAKMQACSSKEKGTSKTCIKQFNVYDVSGGRYKLFSIPAPEGAAGLAKGITGKSPTRHFEPGTHFIAVAAENSAGVESDVNAAKFSVEIKPDAPAGAAGNASH